MVRPENVMTRRKFLIESGEIVLASGLSVYGLSGCATMSVYHGVVENGRIVVDTAVYPELSESGGGILVDSDGAAGPILLINIDGTAFRALSAICTHLGCRVRTSGNFLRCPCHGSTYDLDGKVVRGPAPRALRIFETRVNNSFVDIIVAK